MEQTSNNWKSILIGLMGFVIAVGGGYAYQQFSLISKQNQSQAETIISLQTKIDAYEEDIARRETEKNELENALLAARGEVDNISGQFEDVQDTVKQLEKLSKTDKELLQKYSKVSFLNENYIPSNLTNINKDYIFDKKKEIQIHSKAYSSFKKMLEAAKDDNINILTISGYRSFGDQATLKSNYSVWYGTGSNTFSADQGFSEHQLGTAFDFTDDKIGVAYEKFESTNAYKWLLANAYKYGFILSYPKGNAYYMFEPWHWRFVGVSLAKRLYRDKINFYEMDQRDIDAYLIKIFD